MDANPYQIVLSGGIGSQIIRLIIGIGMAIRDEIEPSQIQIIRCLYDYRTDDEKYRYHNLEDVRKYLKLNPQIKYVFSTDRRKYRAPKFDKYSLDLISMALGHRLFKTYAILDEGFYLDQLDQNHINTVWVRGKDRKSNIPAIEKSLKLLNIENDVEFITNDLTYLTQSITSSPRVVGGSSLEDFKVLINSKCIISQLSGFTVTPFLLSRFSQHFVLLSKASHFQKEYIYLNHDWIFFTSLLMIICDSMPGKKLTIIK